jgi:small-conductance mechanosensitive channel
MSHRPSRYRSDLNFAIEKKFREAGIEIPNPQRDITVRGGLLRVEIVRPEEKSDDAMEGSPDANQPG